MNVAKIQSLSRQHKLLKDFHKISCAPCVELRIHDTTSQAQFDATLDLDTTESIIVGVQGILLDRISDIEEKIKKEADDG